MSETSPDHAWCCASSLRLSPHLLITHNRSVISALDPTRRHAWVRSDMRATFAGNKRRVAPTVVSHFPFHFVWHIRIYYYIYRSPCSWHRYQRCPEVSHPGGPTQTQGIFDYWCECHWPHGPGRNRLQPPEDGQKAQKGGCKQFCDCPLRWCCHPSHASTISKGYLQVHTGCKDNQQEGCVQVVLTARTAVSRNRKYVWRNQRGTLGISIRS